MGKVIEIKENGIEMVLKILEDGQIRFLHFSSRPFQKEEIVERAIPEGFPFVGINLSGIDRPYERHGNKYIVTAPGYRMKYVSHEDTRNESGRLLIFHLKDDQTEIMVHTYMQFYDELPILRCWNTVENQGNDVQTLEYISNFHYEGIEKEGIQDQDEKIRIWIPHSSWQRELNWKCYKLADFGMELNQPKEVQHSSAMIRVSNTGNWSAKEYIPMGYLENKETNTGLFWQIENNGSWYWEIADQNGHLYLALGGPNEIYSHWSKQLKPGDSFTTVTAAVGVTAKGLDDAVGTLTQYRRRIRRPNEDNRKLPVIFNDYMNCLWGNPTTETEIPLIDAAAEAGCEYYCIDAGWYADGNWWDSVGEWKESRKRFPNGLKEVTDYIQKKGMIPGVWIEPEVMGIYCKLVSKVPSDWFFIRHGKPVYDRSRFQLDYRNPEVRAYMDSVIDRLVRDYNIGYIKTDYNIEPGIGTEQNADSFGDGMLEHERSYLSWLDGIFQRHPKLVIENCSSGGLRMDYAMLARLSIQSTSDLEDYLKYPVIAANAPTAVTPEQAAVWSYPVNRADTRKEELEEETIFNMVNAMLLRIHQSGTLAALEPERKELVKEGIQVYKKIRADIPKSQPFWPLGLASYADTWIALGLYTKEKAYLAVWKRPGGTKTKVFPLPDYLEKSIQVQCIYPKREEVSYYYEQQNHSLVVETDKPFLGRLFEINWCKKEN